MPKKSQAKQAISVVDIGSNSVRLVVYDMLARVPTPIFNEKLLCGLATDLEHTGVLYKEGVRRAYCAIARFVKLSEFLGVKHLYIFATAAVRDASDGKDFIANLQENFGTKVTIFSGEQEARYAAQGVISGIPDANGVVADLGGGSLELVSVKKGELKEKGMSFPIGALRLLSIKQNQKQAYKSTIDASLDAFDLSSNMKNKQFYAVGGAFRNLAKMHIGRKGYGLKVLHNYKVDAEDFLETLEVVSKMSKPALQKITLSSKRSDILPVAAMVASRIITLGEPNFIKFSVFGVREGLLFSKLSTAKRKEDPLIFGALTMSQGLVSIGGYAKELEQWMAPLFPDEEEQDYRLRYSACILSEISRMENTEYRAELAFRRILDSTLSGIDHKERVFLAAAVYFRYTARIEDDIERIVRTFLTKKEVGQARRIGFVMRLGRTLSASHEGVLGATSLSVNKQKLRLQFTVQAKDLMGETVEKRLIAVAEEMKLKPVVIL